jgi:hypothetical protein
MRQINLVEKVFGLKIRVRVGGDRADAEQAAVKWTNTVGPVADDGPDYSQAWVIQDADRAFIWLAEWPETQRRVNRGALVHECVHVAISFLRDHMRENVNKSEETCCFLVQSLYSEISYKLDRALARK